MAAKKAKAAAKKAAAPNTDAKVLAKLQPIAHEINVRFEKAQQLDGKADDHRLAAALKLAEAKKLCEENKVAFAKWCEKNVQQAYETVRKLVAVGQAPNPPKALEDLRNKTALAMREHRQKKAAAQSAPRETEPRGPELTPEGELPAIPAPLSGIEAVKEAFDLLKASEKMAFLEYAAEQVGAKVDVGFDPSHPFAQVGEEEAADPLEIPPALRRGRKAKAEAEA